MEMLSAEDTRDERAGFELMTKCRTLFADYTLSGGVFQTVDASTEKDIVTILVLNLGIKRR